MSDQHPLRARPAEPPPLTELIGDWLSPTAEADFALPVIQDLAGSVQAVWGPAGVQNWLEPPTGLPTPIGLLYRYDDDGRPSRVGPEGTDYQWTPWEVRRRHPVVSATTRLHWDHAAVTERLTFHQPGRYALLFGGLCRAWSFAHYWNLPPHDVPQHSVRAEAGTVLIGDTKTFGLAAVTVAGRVGEIVVHLDHDGFVESRPGAERGRVAAVIIEVDEGEQVSWTAAQGSEPAPPPPGSDANAQARWEALWRATFRPGNEEFTGSLPAITMDDPELDRLYYVGVLSLLMGRRRHRAATPRDRFATGGQAIWADAGSPLPVAWTTGATEGAATTSFLWELHLTAPLLARLDPVVLRRQLELFLAADVRRHWGLDVLGGEPVGMWYAINDTALVAAAADYLTATGDRAWLDSTVPGRGLVRELLLEHTEHHRELSGGGALADYGPAENLLECVSTYQHQVASCNAMAAWCYRFAARELAPERAAELTARAAEIEAAVLGLARPEGVFGCGLAEPRPVARTALDLIYVGHYLGDAVPADLRRRMLRFLREELVTPDWLRALSRRDPDSLSAALPEFQTFRADHQSTGSYDGWPAMAATVRARFGEPADTVDWLRRISAVTRQGPFGQAHWVGAGPDAAPATKASFLNGNCYLEVCGSRFAVTLLQLAGLWEVP